MRVGVVGGGLTGLAAVHELHERGIEAVAYEASEEPGGVVSSDELDGITVEHGPQRLRAGGITRTYLESFGLDGALITAEASAPIYVYGGGSLSAVPFGPRAMLRSDVLSWPGKARLLLEPLTGPARDGETVAEYFTRKLGAEAYRAGIEPLVGGLYGSDPAEMPVEYALAPIVANEHGRGQIARIVWRRLRQGRERPPPAVIDGGLQCLPEAIYERHRAAISLDTPVEAVAYDGDRPMLVTEDETVVFDHVIVATDAPAAAALLRQSTPELADHLAALRYNPLALVYLRAPVAREGLGYQVRRDEPLRTLGVSWNGVAFGRDDLVTAFLGGMHDPELVEASDGELLSVAAEELTAVLDVSAEPLGVHRVRPGMPAYDHSFRHRDRITPPDWLHLAGSYTSRVGIPGRLRQARRLAEAIGG